MNLYKISQSVNNGWDTYSDAVVAAETEEQARTIHPGAERDDVEDYSWYTVTWVHPKDVQVEYIGQAAPHVQAGVVCASFHAG